MRFLCAVLLICVLAAPVYAAFEGPRSAAEVTTVALIKDARDKASCQLEGFIIEKTASRRDNYTFQDSTGTITVSIRNKVFQGQNVTPQTRVQIFGIIDREMLGETRIRVRELKVLR